MPQTRRHFTQAAREAAAAARRRKRAARLAFSEAERCLLFVVRASDPENHYGWEIRRFGLLGPVARSKCAYASIDEARAEGRQAMARLQVSRLAG